MNPFKSLANVRAAGAMPKTGLIWLGLGFLPAKRNAIQIDLDRLPSDKECAAIAGLDVVLCVHGFITKYGMLRRLCGSLMASRPRRLQLIDLDYQKMAFLKMGGNQ